MNQSPVFHIRFAIHFEDDAVAELLLVRPQRTDEVAEPFRQHRDGTVDQIDARGTLLCLFVDDGTLLHVMRHVRDVHAHFPQRTTFPFGRSVDTPQRQRIVKILRVVRVNGEGHHVSEVLTPGYLLSRNRGIQTLGSILHALRIFIR